MLPVQPLRFLPKRSEAMGPVTPMCLRLPSVGPVPPRARVGVPVIGTKWKNR